MSTEKAFGWDAPPGFVGYDISWDADDWTQQVLSELEKEADTGEALKDDLLGFTRWCREQEGAEDALWYAGLALSMDERPHIAIVGDIRVGQGADIEPLVSVYEQEYDAPDNVWHRVEFSPSHRAPVLAASRIRAVNEQDGREIFHEDGVALMGLPRLGVTVRMSMTTPDLTAFEDSVEFLLDAVRHVAVTTEAGSYRAER